MIETKADSFNARASPSDSRPLVVILGAGKPYRGVEPAVLTPTRWNRRVLDWLLDALQELGPADLHFVGGYRLEDVLDAWPDVAYSVNPRWEHSGSLGSLLAAPLNPVRATVVCYSDVVVSRKAVQMLALHPEPSCAVVDTEWRERYQSRSETDLRRAEKVVLRSGQVVDLGSDVPVDRADAEFTGLLRLSPTAVRRLLDWKREGLHGGTIPEMVRRLVADGFSVASVEVRGQWAELNAPQDLARFVLGTKAETLERLQPLVRHSRVPPLVRISLHQWKRHRSACRERIHRELGTGPYAVRSSSSQEDHWESSQAGRFVTLLDVSADDLEDAISKVAESYGSGADREQVLVQPLLLGVTWSGVAFTRSLDHHGPYYCLNYSLGEGTDAVTGGRGADLETVVLHRSVVALPAGFPPEVGQLLGGLRELEELVGHESLDIEFAGAGEEIHLLQLRPLVTPRSSTVSDAAVQEALDEARRSFSTLQRPGPGILGNRTIFGVMPDWNPAEILGRRPSRLAVSLYRYLITDEAWAESRAQLGYRDVRPQGLLTCFAGQPYVDCRASFNSLIPAGVPDDLAERLVGNYLDRLEENPHLHDKVEFDISFNCATFDFDARATSQLGHFQASEIAILRSRLQDVSRTLPTACLKSREQLRALRPSLLNLERASYAHLDKALHLLADCRRLGITPFANLARGGFVAVAMLRSLEPDIPGITERFLRSLRTVAGELERDGVRVATGGLSWERFVERYGHLRPGTYDVTSPSYGDKPELYLRRLTARSEC
ncbi:MAG: hypothetical protein AB1758_09335, partial [Candidatus Eremiobacterota bacterium]